MVRILATGKIAPPPKISQVQALWIHPLVHPESSVAHL